MKTVTTEIVVATSNANKRAELQCVAAEFGVTLLLPSEVKDRLGLNEYVAPPEDFPSYLENARAKARSCCNWCGLPSLADDSGLEVTALGGAPGVRSARYAGDDASDKDRIALLLTNVRNVEERTGVVNRHAEFCCALVIEYPDSRCICAETRQAGILLEHSCGTGGFGYDPIFFLESEGKTYAEFDFATTCRVGFRAVAARKLFSQLGHAESTLGA